MPVSLRSIGRPAARFLHRLALVLALGGLLVPPLHAQASRQQALQQIEEMVARCNGDQTCEQIVRKRETRRMERDERNRALQESDPLGYYLKLWGRYLVFVFAVAGAAVFYVFVMRRMFGRK